MGDEHAVKAIVTHRIVWRRVTPDDSDWQFDFPVLPGGLVLCQQVRVFDEDGTARKVWQPVRMID